MVASQSEGHAFKPTLFTCHLSLDQMWVWFTVTLNCPNTNVFVEIQYEAYDIHYDIGHTDMWICFRANQQVNSQSNRVEGRGGGLTLGYFVHHSGVSDHFLKCFDLSFTFLRWSL